MVGLFRALGELLHRAAAERMDRNEYAAATKRWRAINARRPRICPCGVPGVVLLTDHSNLGDVPVKFWRCTEHADVPLTIPWSDGKPLWKQSRGDCSWWTSAIKTGIVSECGCGSHVGEHRGH